MKNKTVSALGKLGCLLLVAGCFGSETKKAADDTSARDALVAVIDSNASRLIQGINQVIIQGDFLKAMMPQNPPQPIVASSDEDMKKAVDYLLTNGTPDGSGQVWTYHPDARLCTEMIAKNDPAECQRLMGQIQIVQTVQDVTSGSVQFEVFGHRPFSLDYSANLFEISTDLAELRLTLIDFTSFEKQNGGHGMSGLPTKAEGRVHSAIQNSDSWTSVFSMGVDQAIEIEGTNQDGGVYRLSVPASPGLASLTLSTLLMQATVKIDVPAFEADFALRDKNNGIHTATLHFPGLSGTMSLDDAAKKISATQFRLTSPKIELDVEGVLVALASSNSELEAELTPAVGGRPAVAVLLPFDAELNVIGLAGLVDAKGSISVSIASGSRFEDVGNGQVKVNAGSFKLEGTGDFLGSADGEPNSCLQGGDKLPEVAACTK